MDAKDRIAELKREIERLRQAPETFLTPQEVSVLTGRRAHKLQIEILRKQGLLFFLNANGKPIVPRTAVEGPRTAPKLPKKKEWEYPD